MLPIHNYIRAMMMMLAAISFLQAAHAQEKSRADFLGAQLLLERYLPDRLVLVGEESDLTLLSSNGWPTWSTPSVSADGSIVAVGRKDGNSDSLVASTYSVKQRKWADHPELGRVWGPVAISPDASKLAYVTDAAPFMLRIVDLSTGAITDLTAIKPGIIDNIGWSPDNRHIVFDTWPRGHSEESEIRAIFVGDTASGTVVQVALGQAASWSPSGEWIAFIAYVEASRWRSQPGDSHDHHYYKATRYQVSVMQPDGTGVRGLMAFYSNVVPVTKPVWSPDSKKLLVTTSRNPDLGTFDVYLLELSTLNRKKEFKNTAPVYAWLPARQ